MISTMQQPLVLVIVLEALSSKDKVGLPQERNVVVTFVFSLLDSFPSVAFS